ncbi:MAG: penicillin acylase family protein [Blastocatellia bacterium]|nr:penicillin acylase family protein [Blastocatellia bacterium]
MVMKKILLVIGTVGLLFSGAFAQGEILTIAGLKDRVTVRRDARSIPYIEAANDPDLYFVQGYVTASDRLWQMDLLRRVARGETAEVFGKTALEEDKRWRRFGFAKIVDDGMAQLSPELRVALDNYARGVNAYIATLDDKSLPVEFRVLQYKPREWRATDSVVVGKILADALSSTWRNDLLRASIQNLPKDKLADLTNQVTPYDVVLFGTDISNAERGMRSTERGMRSADSSGVDYEHLLSKAEEADRVRESSLARIGFYAEDLAASNNWVISGKRTADGKPLLANDPHLRPSAPGIWYLTHLTTPTMRVSGVTFPGVPGIVLGHNENIAWGATNVGPDVQDLYIETFDADGKYKTPTGPATPVTRREEIKVRSNSLKLETETVVLDVVETRNGPIILEDGGKKYALKWTARDPKNSEFEAFYFLNRAKDWNQFKTALKTYGGATQNFVYADVKGNIGWYAAGQIPIRKVGDGAFPYDGATDDGEWTGSIPFDELPNLYNPKDGFIVTANQRIVGTSYKYQQISRDAAGPWRARRIYDLLKDDTKVTMDKVAAIQHDSYNIPLANLAKEIVAANAASAETLRLLKGWDGRMTPDSKAALIVNEIRNCIGDKIAANNRPAPGFVIRERILDWAIRDRSPRWLASGSDYPALMTSCDSEIRVSLADPKRLGPDESKWNWGRLSQSRLPHPLAVAPFIGGQFATPQVGLAGSGQTPNVASAVSMRLIASPGNWDATRHVIPLGQSGDPQSPHYKDQFEAWRTGTPMIFPFTKKAVETGALLKWTFQPGK